MNIYLITRPDQEGNNTFDTATVIANTPEEARMCHPGHFWKWDGTKDSTWIDAEDVIVTYIGVADIETPKGVICASFNA